MTPRIGADFVGWRAPTGGDSTLGLVDFSIFPHLDHEMLPENTMAGAERWAAGLGGPAYAIDDQTAIKVVDDVVEVVSEGHWSCSRPESARPARCAEPTRRRIVHPINGSTKTPHHPSRLMTRTCSDPAGRDSGRIDDGGHEFGQLGRGGPR